MANNRLYLVDVVSGEKTLLAKYYPSTGWYLHNTREYVDAWFDKIQTLKDVTQHGHTHFVLRYEHIDENDEGAKLADAKPIINTGG